MNIYSLTPKWLKCNALETIINILKVKKVYCFIPSYDSNELKGVETLFTWDGTNIDDFLKKCVYDFVNILCEPLFFNGDYTGERIVKNLFSESLGLNPIYNIENLDDPNILILWTPDVPKRGITLSFRTYSMNILNKYGTIDYMDRICFYYFDSFLSSSYIFKKTHRNMNMKWEYRLYRAVIASRYTQYDSETKVSKYVDHSYDPLLSYMYLKTNNFIDGNSLQDRFLTSDGIKEFEDYTLQGYFDYKNELWSGYEPDERVKEKYSLG